MRLKVHWGVWWNSVSKGGIQPWVSNKYRDCNEVSNVCKSLLQLCSWPYLKAYVLITGRGMMLLWIWDTSSIHRISPRFKVTRSSRSMRSILFWTLLTASASWSSPSSSATLHNMQMQHRAPCKWLLGNWMLTEIDTLCCSQGRKVKS